LLLFATALGSVSLDLFADLHFVLFRPDHERRVGRRCIFFWRTFFVGCLCAGRRPVMIWLRLCFR
jgi:hypothetical protein